MTRQIYIQKQRFTISGGKGVMLEFEINEDRVIMFNERGGKDFVFDNSNTRDILDYWREVLKCMDIAVMFALGELDKDRVTKLKLNSKAKSRKGR